MLAAGYGLRGAVKGYIHTEIANTEIRYLSGEKNNF